MNRKIFSMLYDSCKIFWETCKIWVSWMIYQASIFKHHQESCKDHARVLHYLICLNDISCKILLWEKLNSLRIRVQKLHKRRHLFCMKHLSKKYFCSCLEKFYSSFVFILLVQFFHSVELLCGLNSHASMSDSKSWQFHWSTLSKFVLIPFSWNTFSTSLSSRFLGWGSRE